MAREQQDSTKQLLQQVVEQLALQTEELKHIRRYALQHLRLLGCPVSLSALLYHFVVLL